MQAVGWIHKQVGKIADKFENYKFYVHSTPENIDSSTRLFLNAYSSRDQQAMVPCTYKWFRLKNGINSEVLEYKGNTFICEPSDVGSFLQAEVTSIDEQYPGTAIMRYGPVEIDVLLRQTIEGALSTGEAKFPVDLGHFNRNKQCSLMVTEEYMRIAHCNSTSHFKFYYCLGQPLINSLPKDPTNVEMVFPQKYETETIKFFSELWSDFCLTREQRSSNELSISLKFINRRSKDEFLFVLKGFIAKRQLKTSNVIKKIQKLDIDSSNINYMMQIQSLRRDLLKMNNVNHRQQDQKKIYMQETIKLEHQIEDIISSYTKLIQGKFKTKEEFQESFIQFQNRKDNAVNHKYQKIEDQNTRLKEYIRDRLDQGENKNQLELLKENQGRGDYTSNNPFNKKKEPFAVIQAKKMEYEQILNNLSQEEEMPESQQEKLSQMAIEKQKLENKLGRSLQKIEKLEDQIQRMNRSVMVDANSSFSRNNTSALDISTNRVVEEKDVLQKKYAKLKEDYLKLKNAYDGVKDNRQGDGSNPEFDKQTGIKQMTRLRSAFASMERQKEQWKEQAQNIACELRREKEGNEKTRSKLDRKLSELNQEVEVSRRGNDVLNRSQHLSMEMDEYNSQQNQILKEQNTFLMNQNERLTKMCEKYKSEYKKIKEAYRGSNQSLLV